MNPSLAGVALVVVCSGCSPASSPSAPHRPGAGPPLDSAIDTSEDSASDTNDSGFPAGLGTLQIHMLDVGQGDAVFVVSPSGQTMLYDAGDEAEYFGLHRYVRNLGYSIDYTVVSHQHADHMGAMDLVLRDFPGVVAAYDGGGFAGSQSFADYVAAAGDRRTTLSVGQTIDIGDGLSVEVLHSDIGDTENENNNSLVLRLTHGDIRVLLGGDCESWGCERSFSPGPIDLYKVHHHGSSDSSAFGFLREMSPSIALIGVGAGNDYGHPDAISLEKFRELGTDVYRTDLDGNIVVTSNGYSTAVATQVQ